MVRWGTWLTHSSCPDPGGVWGQMFGLCPLERCQGRSVPLSLSLSLLRLTVLYQSHRDSLAIRSCGLLSRYKRVLDIIQVLFLRKSITHLEKKKKRHIVPLIKSIWQKPQAIITVNEKMLKAHGVRLASRQRCPWVSCCPMSAWTWHTAQGSSQGEPVKKATTTTIKTLYSKPMWLLTAKDPKESTRD